jgi:hypothetical protein
MLRPIATLSVLVLALGGCRGPAANPPANTPNAAETTTAETKATQFCKVDLPDSWRSALAAGTLKTDPGAGEWVVAASDDATAEFVQVTRAGSRTLDYLSAGRTTVLTLAVNDEVVESSFDGRWLVFAVAHNPENLSLWSLYVWDSQTRSAPKRIVDNTTDAPLIRPVARHGKAAWLSNAGQLHFYDLATGKDTVLTDAHATTAFFTDSWLLWRAGDNANGRLRAVDAAAGTPVTLPAALTGETAMQYVAGGGDTIVWTKGNTMMGWRDGWADAKQLITIDKGPIQWPHVGGDLVTFGDVAAYFVADLRSGSYTQVTPEAGDARALPGGLIVGYYSGDKTKPGPSTVVATKNLPALPACH